MILWTIKLISSVRKAIAGRRHPGQLAWGVALGALIGMIPHGNLLAVVLVLLVLMLQVNHAMVALVGVAVTFLAPRLDPAFDSLGRWFFQQPGVADRLAVAWQYPLVPWTDLNNTIVMGSFIIGLASVGPLLMVTYPLFRALAPVLVDPEAEAKADSQTAPQDETKPEPTAAGDAECEPTPPNVATPTVKRLDTSHAVHDSSHVDTRDASESSASPVNPAQADSITAESDVAVGPSGTDARRPQAGSSERVPATSQSAQDSTPPRAIPQPVAASKASRPTRVAIGTSVSRRVNTTETVAAARAAQSTRADDSTESPVDEQHKIDEALSYLLRQLRDSKDKDAA